jgi:hypothetical protein
MTEIGFFTPKVGPCAPRIRSIRAGGVLRKSPAVLVTGPLPFATGRSLRDGRLPGYRSGKIAQDRQGARSMAPNGAPARVPRTLFAMRYGVLRNALECPGKFA